MITHSESDMNEEKEMGQVRYGVAGIKQKRE